MAKKTLHALIAFCFGCAPALVSAAPPPSQPKSATAGAPLAEREAWYEFNFYNKKVGFLYAKDQNTTVNAKPAFLVHRFSVVEVRRTEQVIRMESTTDSWFSADGTPIRFKHNRFEGKERRSLEGYRDGDQLVLRTDVGGNVQEKRLPYVKATTSKGPCKGPVYLASSLDALFFRDLAKGKELSGCALDEQEGAILDFKLTVTAVKGAGASAEYTIEETLGPLTSKVMVAADGTMLSTEMIGIGATFVKVEADQAVKMATQVDIFSAALFALKKRLPAGHQLDRLVVRVSSKSKRALSVPTDTRQTGKNDKGTITLELTTATAPTRPASRPISDPKVKAFLKETDYEPLKDETLVAASQRAVGDAKDVYSAAKAINKFVNAHIEKKSLARAFATATEAYETKEGDCTEHSVLFSALAKIAGVPTRLATGLVYVDSESPVFGYHEWVEIWTGSDWVAMDPTFGQDLADPTHIKFAVGQSDADGIREAGMVAAAMIGDLDLEVVEYYGADGKRVKF